MINDLSKDLLLFLELIYEEIPNEISIKDLKNMMPFHIFRARRFKKLLDFCKDERYVLIKSEKITLTAKGKDHLFELREYFSHNSKEGHNGAMTIAIISLIISFMAVLLTAIPASPKVYWTQMTSICPDELTPQGNFKLILSNYGTIPSLIIVSGEGEGINIIRYYSDNKSAYIYQNSFMLPPTQISGKYEGDFTMKVLDTYKDDVSFKMKYNFTSYFLGFVPIQSTFQGKTFECCYKKEGGTLERYDLIDCN